MRFVVDIDGYLVTESSKDVSARHPLKSNVLRVNRLYDRGHTIILFTARGMNSCNNDQLAADEKYREITEAQLESIGVKYHSLMFGKPNADVYLDNKNGNIEDYDNSQSEIVCITSIKNTGFTSFDNLTSFLSSEDSLLVAPGSIILYGINKTDPDAALRAIFMAQMWCRNKGCKFSFFSEIPNPEFINRTANPLFDHIIWEDYMHNYTQMRYVDSLNKDAINLYLQKRFGTK